MSEIRAARIPFLFLLAMKFSFRHSSLQNRINLEMYCAVDSLADKNATSLSCTILIYCTHLNFKCFFIL